LYNFSSLSQVSKKYMRKNAIKLVKQSKSTVSTAQISIAEFLFDVSVVQGGLGHESLTFNTVFGGQAAKLHGFSGVGGRCES
jgi:hypothetical protein